MSERSSTARRPRAAAQARGSAPARSTSASNRDARVSGRVNTLLISFSRHRFPHAFDTPFKIIFYLALPEPQHCPAIGTEGVIIRLIPCTIAHELSIPEVPVGFWPGVVARAAMPEAPVYHDCDLGRAKA